MEAPHRVVVCGPPRPKVGKPGARLVVEGRVEFHRGGEASNAHACCVSRARKFLRGKKRPDWGHLPRVKDFQLEIQGDVSDFTNFVL